MRERETLTYIDEAIPDDLPTGEHVSTDITHIPQAYVQDVLNVLWDVSALQVITQKPSHLLLQLLDPQKDVGAAVVGVKTHRPLPLNALRRLATKLAVHYSLLPASFYLKGVKCTNSESCGNGSFADIFLGEWEGTRVALKRLRVDTRDPSGHLSLQKVCILYRVYASTSRRFRSYTDACFLKQFCRESLLWRKLHHEHVLPFLGVSDDAFELTICMILPWMESGNIRRHMSDLRREGKLVGHDFVKAVDQWVCLTSTVCT